MPFFSKNIDDRNKKYVTLQVRVPGAGIGFSAKRALSSALFQKAYASLTVEAAMVLPLFLFSMVILMMPMKFMDEGRRVQTALEGACEDVSQYAYIMDQLKQEEAAEYLQMPGLIGELAGALKKETVIFYVKRKVESQAGSGRLTDVSFRRSSILADGETIDLVMDYRLKLPFPVLGLKSVPMTARSSRRAWIGRALKDGEETGSKEEDELVFVGKSSTRYHISRTCHYLYNNISQVSFEEAEKIHNSFGKKYKPCSRCGDRAGKGEAVYIMPGGEHFHSNRDCSSITSYVQAVPLSEVSHLGPCSYCSK